MEWVEPRYSREQVDRAGRVFRRRGGSLNDVAEAYDIVSNWRASHAFPLNTFQTVLRVRAREVDDSPLIAQRLKRFPSIVKKLRARSTMRLSQMQDIGGCRAVVESLPMLSDLRNIYMTRRTPATLINTKDYVASPAPSGYRSIHLVYRYKSARGQHRAVFDGHLIEIQLRTQVQHAWATAVETVGTIIGQALKSSEGPEEWLVLLRDVASLFAYHEGTPPVLGTLPRPTLTKQVRREANKLSIRDRLLTFANALQTIESVWNREDRYFLLNLRPGEESLEITSYRAGQIDEATQQYMTLEKEATLAGPSDIVLVRADSIDALRRAYPNYFLDTKLFLGLLDLVTQ